MALAAQAQFGAGADQEENSVIGEIKLKWHEGLIAALVGCLRQLYSAGSPDAYGFNGEDGWTKHIEGACGEMAVAKLLNVYWPAKVNSFGIEPDIDPDIQVKTRSREEYELLVRPGDDDDQRFVLVIGRFPNYVIHGWMYGRDAKQECWAKEHGGRPLAYFVPKENLEPQLWL